MPQLGVNDRHIIPIHSIFFSKNAIVFGVIRLLKKKRKVEFGYLVKAFFRGLSCILHAFLNVPYARDDPLK